MRKLVPFVLMLGGALLVIEAVGSAMEYGRARDRIVAMEAYAPPLHPPVPAPIDERSP